MISWYCLGYTEIFLYDGKDVQKGKYSKSLCSKVIGEGGYSKIERGKLVRRGKCGFKKISVAIKSKLTADEDWLATKSEASIILKMKDNQFIVNLIGVDFTSRNFIVAFELCNPKPILEHVSQLHNDERVVAVLYVGAAMINALSFMHRKEYLHCDIKSENIVLSKTGVPKLIDFGLSCKVKNAKIGEGTVLYMAPEIMTTGTSYKTDSFSLGATLATLLTGLAPYIYHTSLIEKFKNEKQADRLGKLMLNRLNLEDGPRLKKKSLLYQYTVKDIIFGLVQIRPAERDTIRDKENSTLVQLALNYHTDLEIEGIDKVKTVESFKLVKNSLLILSRGNKCSF